MNKTVLREEKMAHDERKGAEENGAYLADGHGAEDVEEDEGAVGIIFPHQVSMRQTLDPTDWSERQFCHDATVETKK